MALDNWIIEDCFFWNIRHCTDILTTESAKFKMTRIEAGNVRGYMVRVHLIFLSFGFAEPRCQLVKWPYHILFINGIWNPHVREHTKQHDYERKHLPQGADSSLIFWCYSYPRYVYDFLPGKKTGNRIKNAAANADISLLSPWIGRWSGLVYGQCRRSFRAGMRKTCNRCENRCGLFDDTVAAGLDKPCFVLFFVFRIPNALNLLLWLPNNPGNYTIIVLISSV